MEKMIEDGVCKICDLEFRMTPPAVNQAEMFESINPSIIHDTGRLIFPAKLTSYNIRINCPMS